MSAVASHRGAILVVVVIWVVLHLHLHLWLWQLLRWRWRCHVDADGDAFVVIGVDADLALLGGERVEAVGQGAQLVLRAQVGPAKQATVDDVRQALAVRDLEAAVE